VEEYRPTCLVARCLANLKYFFVASTSIEGGLTGMSKELTNIGPLLFYKRKRNREQL
jgi:hypothetical protein